MFWKKKPKELYFDEGSEEFRMRVEDEAVHLTVSNRNWDDVCYWQFTDEQFNALGEWVRKEQERRWYIEQEHDYKIHIDAKQHSNDEQLAAMMVGKKIRVLAVDGPDKKYEILWKEVQDMCIDEQGHMAVQLVEDEPDTNWHYVPFTTPIYVRN